MSYVLDDETKWSFTIIINQKCVVKLSSMDLTLTLYGTSLGVVIVKISWLKARWFRMEKTGIIILQPHFYRDLTDFTNNFKHESHRDEIKNIRTLLSVGVANTNFITSALKQIFFVALKLITSSLVLMLRSFIFLVNAYNQSRKIWKTCKLVEKIINKNKKNQTFKIRIFHFPWKISLF